MLNAGAELGGLSVRVGRSLENGMCKMQGSTPQHYTIADFLKWNDDDELILNPKFQRGNVWPPPARSYLIDSLLRGYPIPKILLRTAVDRDSRRTIRDVVDGQQRLRTIIEFAGNRFALGSKASEFRGMRYADLEDEQKDSFLAYKLTCEQLINASDDDVLEVFVRINSYAVPVNEPELRNPRFETEFSDLVKTVTKRIRPIWELGVLSDRERVRMMDQSFVAEVLGFWIFGMTDGGESKLTKMYETLKGRTAEDLPNEDAVVAMFLETAVIAEEFKGEPLVQRPHLLMMIAAMMYMEGQLPILDTEGSLNLRDVPAPEDMLNDFQSAMDQLSALNVALSGEETRYDVVGFLDTRTTTHRMKSRQARFRYFCQALAGQLSA